MDDNGVIVGNWTSAFTGGTAPTDWTGSAKILHLFAQNIQPVLFGQCWEHHTDEYNVTKIPKNVRRGQSFTIDLTFYRDFIIENDELKYFLFRC